MGARELDHERSVLRIEHALIGAAGMVPSLDEAGEGKRSAEVGIANSRTMLSLASCTTALGQQIREKLSVAPGTLHLLHDSLRSRCLIR